MKFHLYFLTLLSSFSFLFAQNTAPEVTNVTFSQRTDGSFMVDVHYDVHDSDGDNMTISMQVSDDAGVTFNFSADQITGDIGENITSATAKHIVWDFGAEHSQTYSDQIQIKVIADDNAAGGETGTVTDIDGNVYQTIKIGDQWWLAENLKTIHYRNGEAIPGNEVGDAARRPYRRRAARGAVRSDSWSCDGLEGEERERRKSHRHGRRTARHGTGDLRTRPRCSVTGRWGMSYEIDGIPSAMVA